MRYFAHSKENSDEEQWQTIKAHSENVAELCAIFSERWCSREYAYDLGLLHDIGKYQSDFQYRIRGHNEIHVEHSICGALECERYLLPFADYCVAGHHSGLPDIGTRVDPPDESTLIARKKRKMQDYSAYTKELTLYSVHESPWKIELSSNTVESKKQIAFWIRMMFSALVDADYLDTELFYCGNNDRGLYADFDECIMRIEKKLSSFVPDTFVKKARALLLSQILSRSTSKADLYLMNMPTGSGKTLASMYFALLQAKKFDLKRIIYVIPYTSIIEQNAHVFKELFGENAVLEHHCNFDSDLCEDAATAEKVLKAAENWDASIVVTTNVRFFESIYANKTSETRRLHNIAQSMIVFDEVQMFPLRFYRPCLEAVSILVKDYSCKAVFMSATMPDFSRWLSEFGGSRMQICDLIEDTSVFTAFERYRIADLKTISKERLVSSAQEHVSALIVVNKRKSAREVYNAVSGRKYHLSTYMTKKDRNRIIRNVKNDLMQGEKFVLVSTSLIEAGVDLDFSCVFRERTGIDSILQTAGRCNREGKRDRGTSIAYVFDFEESELRSNDKSTEIRRYLCSEIFEKYGISEKETIPNDAVREYFDRLFSYVRNDMNMFDFAAYITPFGFDFDRYAHDFKLIDDGGNDIVIVYPDDVEERSVFNEIYDGKRKRRKLQNYAVSLRSYEWKELYEQGVISNKDGIFYLSDFGYYDPETGIKFENDDVYIV